MGGICLSSGTSGMPFWRRKSGFSPRMSCVPAARSASSGWRYTWACVSSRSGPEVPKWSMWWCVQTICRIACGAMPTSASAPRNAAALSAVFIPVSISVHASPARTRYTLTMVGRTGRGRNTCTTPSATSRVLAPSPMLLVHVLLHGEADPHPHSPRRDAAVLDHRADAVDLDLGLDALQGGGRAGDREPDGVLD